MKLFYNNSKYIFNNIGLYKLNEEEVIDKDSLLDDIQDGSSDFMKIVYSAIDSSNNDIKKDDNQSQFNNEIEKLNTLSSTIQQLTLNI